MTTPLNLPALRAAIAARGECAGPRTTFPEPGMSEVTILCRDNWVEVIEWLDVCVKQLPECVARIEELERALERMKTERDALFDEEMKMHHEERPVRTEVRILKAEVERLRGLVEEACECLPGDNEGNRFHAENIRLRALAGQEEG